MFFFGTVLGEFVPVVFEIGRGTPQERAGFAAQGMAQPLAGLFVGGLAPGGFRGGRSALSGADVEPRLQGESGTEEGRRCREVCVAEVGMVSGEEFFVEPSGPITGTM